MLQQNQVHPPRKKVDSQGNVKKKLWLKDGRTTMPFVEGLTANAYKVLINSINTTLIKLGGTALPNNKFLITQ